MKPKWTKRIRVTLKSEVSQGRETSEAAIVFCPNGCAIASSGTHYQNSTCPTCGAQTMLVRKGDNDGLALKNSRQLDTARRMSQMSDDEAARYEAWKANLNPNRHWEPTPAEIREARERIRPETPKGTVQPSEPGVVSDTANIAFYIFNLFVWLAAILLIPYTFGLSLIGAILYNWTRRQMSDYKK